MSEPQSLTELSREELEDLRQHLVTEMRNIDAQISERRSDIEELKDERGFAPREDWVEFTRWRASAGRAKSIMEKKALRISKELKRRNPDWAPLARMSHQAMFEQILERLDRIEDLLLEEEPA